MAKKKTSKPKKNKVFKQPKRTPWTKKERLEQLIRISLEAAKGFENSEIGTLFLGQAERAKKELAGLKAAK